MLARTARATDWNFRMTSPCIVFMLTFVLIATVRAAAHVLQTSMADRSGCRFHVLGQCGKCELVPEWTHAANNSQCGQRDERLVIHRFAAMNVGDMNFDNWKFGRFQRIEQRH